MSRTSPSSTDAAAILSYRQRLVLYVVWHPRFAFGSKFADSLCTHLNAPPTQPGGGGLGIPVLFRSHPAAGGVPRPIDFTEARNTAVVVLVEDGMVNAPGWESYVDNLSTAAEAAVPAGAHRIFPVQLSPNAFNLSRRLAAINYIRPFDAPPYPPLTEDRVQKGLTDEWEVTVTRFRNALVHELCRLLLHKPRVDHEEAALSELSEREKVKIFISHTKADGLPVAMGIKEYIEKETQLWTFFDANDIDYGKKFDPALKRAVGADNSALLIVHTDAYSGSVWCLDELVEAKKARRPVLVVNAVATGEERSPVYAGNVPTRRHPPQEHPPGYDRIVARMLLEVLRREHFIQNFEDVRALFGLPGDIEPLPYPPEPLTLAHLKMGGVKTKRFVYPDPPLSELELESLQALDKDITLTTPLLLLATQARSADRADPRTTNSAGPTPRLQGARVAVSVGNSPDLSDAGLSKWHLNDATVTFARYLLACGADLAYGGIPQLEKGPDGTPPPDFLDQLLNMARAHNQGGNAPRGLANVPLKNFVAEVYRGRFSSGFRARWKSVLELEDVPAGIPEPADGADEAERAYYTARSLTAMREEMNRKIDARVLLGGKSFGFEGKYPGLVEEAYLAMAAKTPRPVYLAGAFGGAARAVIDALRRKTGDPPVEVLTRTYQEAKSSAYAAMAAVYDRESAAGRVQGIAYGDLAQFFARKGVKFLSKHNGLSVSENYRLFDTPHVVEMVYLVLLGLARTLGRQG